MSYHCDIITCDLFNVNGNINVNGSSGTNGQVLANVSGNTSWTSMSSFSNYMRFFNNVPMNVNTSTNVFATNGQLQTDIGSPFIFNQLTGTFFCNKTGIYTFTFKTILSTHNAQSKFVYTNGTNILATCDIDYLPDITTEQPFQFTATLPAVFNQVWDIGFISIGVGGVINTSGVDPLAGCPTTTLEIVGI